MLVKKKVRADVLMTTLGLAESRHKAQALILAGKVFHGERRIDKAGDLVGADAPLELRGVEALQYVSRGGVKLAGALQEFGVEVAGGVAADIGASTGGFTDCLLQHGVTRVYAIDVGYGQLHQRLRQDARVVVMERLNARYLDEKSLPEAIDVVSIDASFIGLGKLLPAAARLLRPGGVVLALVKPQFEVGRVHLAKGGVVRDAAARAAAIDAVGVEATALGFVERGRCDCCIAGPAGNLEAFLWLQLLRQTFSTAHV